MSEHGWGSTRNATRNATRNGHKTMGFEHTLADEFVQGFYTQWMYS